MSDYDFLRDTLHDCRGRVLRLEHDQRRLRGEYHDVQDAMTRGGLTGDGEGALEQIQEQIQANEHFLDMARDDVQDATIAFQGCGLDSADWEPWVSSGGNPWCFRACSPRECMCGGP